MQNDNGHVSHSAATTPSDMAARSSDATAFGQPLHNVAGIGASLSGVAASEAVQNEAGIGDALSGIAAGESVQNEAGIGAALSGIASGESVQNEAGIGDALSGIAAGESAQHVAATDRQPGEPLKIAVFASGSGSNFQAIADAVNAGKLRNVSIELLVCDKPSAKVVERAKLAQVPQFVFRPKDYASREAYETEILAQLREKRIDLVVLAGYMRIITATLVEPFSQKMINIHPSLLPAFPGLDGIGQALAHGVKVTGVTVHFVDGGMDTGPIIAQSPVAIREGESRESLEARIHEAEHELYCMVIQKIADGKVHVDGRHVRVDV